MHGQLPIAADVAATVDLSDRTETRLRQPGDFPPAGSLDVSTVPEAACTLAVPRFGATLKYAPRLTFWDLNDGGGQATWLDAGTAHIDWRAAERATLTLDEDASYGATSFAALTLPAAPAGTAAGTPPHVDVIPAPRILQLESTTTMLGSRLELRRWEIRSGVGYRLTGGADDASRAALPLQKGPLADAVVTYAGTPVDHFATTVSGEDTTFSSGPEIALVEGDEGWRHAWSAVTETTLALGYSAGRVEAAPSVGVSQANNPVAEAVLEQKILSADDRVTLHVGARLGPVVNRLLGIVDERAQGTLQSKWTHGPFTVTAFGSAQQSVSTNEPYATTLFLGEVGLSYTATRAVVLEAGVRGLWQKADQPLSPASGSGPTEILESNITQGVIFVGATFRAPTIHL